MQATLPIDTSAPSRDLLRILRNQPDRVLADEDMLPESILWNVYCELRRRGEDGAERYFLRSVRHLHRRRSIGCADLPTTDPNPEEHKMVDDPMLAELWKAYKRCICNHRTGPAASLLRDIEAQIMRH